MAEERPARSIPGDCGGARPSFVIIVGDAGSGDLIMPLSTRLTERLGIAHPGGIADGRGLAASLMLGAEGVLVGTRFYASAEALAHPEAKARMTQARGDETIRTTTIDIVRDLPWPADFTVRAMRNDFVARWHGAEADLRAARQTEIARYMAAARDGDFAVAGVLGGEAMGLFDAVLPAGEIVTRMVAEAEAALRDGARRVVAQAPV
jgi:nitronate monooxygenase